MPTHNTTISRRLRTSILERDNYQCQRCGISIMNQRYSVHHRKLRSHASPDEVNLADNLITLCGSGTTGCHGWVHAHPAEAREQGYIISAYRPVTAFTGHRNESE